MAAWILGIIGVAVFAAAIYAIATSGPKARAREERRRRFYLEETGERIDLAGEPEGTPSLPPIGEVAPSHEMPSRGAEAAPAVVETQDPRPSRKALGRLVMTPDGEAILTTPPFELREAIFTHKSGRYVSALYRRVPPWVVVCPKVRLDALLTPTAPDGRDAEDWRTWRNRVRVRSVDFVLCDRRTWKPLLAVVIDGAHSDAHKVGGGKDRIIDEVLGAVGLPFVRGTGRFVDDWPMIRPHVEHAILPAPDETETVQPDEGGRARPNGAVAMLRMDEHKGWLLE